MKQCSKWMFAISVILTVALAGCSSKPSDTQASSAASQPDSGVTAAQGTVSGEISFVTDDEEFTGRSIGNAQGYYYVDRGGGIAANLRYIDYASKQDIFLSSRPEGDHFSPEDESYVASVAGSGVVFPLGDTLYLVRSGAPDYLNDYGSEALAAIFTMNLNGSERQELYLGSASETFLSTIAADDENLYLVSVDTQTENDVPVQRRYLVQVNRKTGEKKTLTELTDSAWMIGASGNYLVFHSIYAETGSETTAPTMTHEIFVYRFDTKSLSVVKSWPQEQMLTVKVYADTLVTADAVSKTLTVQDLESAETKNTFSLTEHMPTQEAKLWFEECRDGKFMFWDYEHETLSAIDLETGEWKTVTLTYQDPEKQEARPVEIYAETETDFLVCYDKQTVMKQSINLAGVLDQSESVQPCFALIAKEDYWNSVPNFQKITFNN